jgi:DNA (cytosine-5)-methyltransferase 3A
MRVLSLFDGISCARVALERAGIDVEAYYASEIDKHAIAVSKKNYPDIIQLGSVVGLTPPEEIDLLIGGSPCQDLSIAKKDRKGLDGDRSGLFWEYVRIKEECKPTYFILENVASMAQKDKDTITKTLGVQPVLFNASLVSAQCRKRLFWTNLKFELPEDRGILLQDILQPDAEVDERMLVDGKAFTLTATYSKVSASDAQVENSIQRKQRTMVKVGYIGGGEQYGQGGQAHRVYSPEGKTPTLSSAGPLVKIGHIGKSDAQANRVYDPSGKSCTLSANGGGLGAKTGLYQANDRIRKLTPIECERLQCLPDNYTDVIAKTNRYKCLGNAFNVDVVAHILSSIHNGRD